MYSFEFGFPNTQLPNHFIYSIINDLNLIHPKMSPPTDETYCRCSCHEPSISSRTKPRPRSPLRQQAKNVQYSLRRPRNSPSPPRQRIRNQQSPSPDDPGSLPQRRNMSPLRQRRSIFSPRPRSLNEALSQAHIQTRSGQRYTRPANPMYVIYVVLMCVLIILGETARLRGQKKLNQ